MIVQNSKFKIQYCISKFKVFCFFLILIFNFALLTFNLRKASAQTFSLSIWPPLLEVMIQPGRTVTQVYKIANLADEQTLVAKVLPFEPSDSVGNINLLNIPSLLNPLSFSFENSEIKLGKPFLLKPGESKDLVLKISVPKRTPEKDFYASLVFETSPQEKVGLSQSQTAAKIVGNILLTVSIDGQPPKKGRILEFSAPKIIDSFDPVNFVLEIENIGPAFFKPFGEIKIEGIFNQMGKIKILPENVLAGFSRKMHLEPWKNRFILGPFRARVEFSLDDPSAEEKLSAQTTFLALPYKAILALVVIVLILLTFKNLPKKINSPP
jgi:hypothetical protein